jgi:site-specific DNA-cytosine methylase
VRMVGNSVPPPVVAAIVRANVLTAADVREVA